MSNDATDLPVFAFTTRKGGNYPADQPGLPKVRQFPHQHTACLDDKRQLQQHLQAAGKGHLLPPSWANLQEYTCWLQEQHENKQEHLQIQQEQQQYVLGPGTAHHPCDIRVTQACPCHAAPDASSPAGGTGSLNAATTSPSSNAQPSNGDPDSGPDTQLPSTVFVKHRRGVKGQAVYVAHTAADLQQLLQKLKGSAAEFVVQQEVAPPMLLEGRKFVLRVHVLVVLCQEGHAVPGAGGAEQGSRRGGLQARPVLEQGAGICAAGPVQDNRVAALPGATKCADGDQGVCSDAHVGSTRPLGVYVHDDVIVLPHASEYHASSKSPAVHISSKGTIHPKPFLLQQLPELHATVWPQLQQLALNTIEGVAPALAPPAVHLGAQLYHLFGFDCMVDAVGKVVLLEVNSYPAIASGTMSAVDPGVYSRLVRDMATLLVLPLTDGIKAEPGGFVICRRS